jgi:hypothetical protein
MNGSPPEEAAMNDGKNASMHGARHRPAADQPAAGNEERIRLLARIEEVGDALRAHGVGAFRSAFAAFKQARLTPHATVAAALFDLLENLVETDEPEVAADMLLWILQQAEVTIPPNRLHRFLRQVVARGHAQAVGDRLAVSAELSPRIQLVLGLIRIAQGAQLAGAGLCRQAMGGALPAGLHAIAAAEITAARFHALGDRHVAGGEALVIIEQNAHPDLVRLVLDHAKHVHICAGPNFTPQSLHGITDAADLQRVNLVKFRSYDIPEIMGVIGEFSHRFVRAAVQEMPLLRSFAIGKDDHAAALETVLRLILYNPVRWFFNAVEAIRTTGARRIFFIANSGWLSIPLAAHLLESKEPYELWIASASPFAGWRLDFSRAVASPDFLKAFAGDDFGSPAVDKGQDQAVPSTRPAVASPFVDLVPEPPVSTTKRRCIVCATGPDGRVPFPLRAVIEALLDEWDPILMIVTNRRFTEPVMDRIREQLGDLLPKLAIKLFDSVPPPERQIPKIEFVDSLSRLLAQPELAQLECRGVTLAPLLRRYCLQFLWRLTHVAESVATLDHALHAWAPQFLLVQQNYQLDAQVLQLAARRRAIPTLGLQIFLYGRDPRNAGPPGVDHFLCFDRFARETLTEMTGFPPDRISVIGSVRYDAALRQARSYDPHKERQALGVEAAEKVVVVATQPLSVEENRQLVEIALEALHNVGDVRLVIKLHPREPESRLAVHRRQVDQWGMSDRAVVTKDYDMYRLLTAADLLINVRSNVGVEAALLDRNVVAAEVGVELDPDSFSLDSIGLVEAVRTRQDAIRQIRALLVDPVARAAAEAKRHDFFAKNPELRDGRSIERMMDVLRKAASGDWPGRI